jgi:hypothetical protein
MEGIHSLIRRRISVSASADANWARSVAVTSCASYSVNGTLEVSFAPYLAQSNQWVGFNAMFSHLVR